MTKVAKSEEKKNTMKKYINHPLLHMAVSRKKEKNKTPDITKNMWECTVGSCINTQWRCCCNISLRNITWESFTNTSVVHHLYFSYEMQVIVFFRCLRTVVAQRRRKEERRKVRKEIQNMRWVDFHLSNTFMWKNMNRYAAKF